MTDREKTQKEEGETGHRGFYKELPSREEIGKLIESMDILRERPNYHLPKIFVHVISPLRAEFSRRPAGKQKLCVNPVIYSPPNSEVCLDGSCWALPSASHTSCRSSSAFSDSDSPSASPAHFLLSPPSRPLSRKFLLFIPIFISKGIKYDQVEAYWKFGKMGKYSALGRHLKGLYENEISLSFNEVEEILGFDLPKSARKHRPWWANDDSHVQARDGWLRYGWKSQNIDMRKETVEFARSEDRAEAVLEHENVERGVTSEMTGAEFEEIARRVMEDYLDVDLLTPRQIEDLPKLFDFVSEDRNVIGEAKFFSMVRGEKIPPAKFSAIAEHVWLLEKVDAEEKFLVFGRDRRVPEEWLKRYGPLVDDIDIYFIDEEGSVSKLNKDVKHAPN